MITKLTHVTIFVKDLDEALRFYRDKLGFKVKMDDSTTMPGFRWLTVAPAQQSEVEIALTLPMMPGQDEMIGKQGALLASNDIRADYERLRAAGVKVLGEPMVKPYGTDFQFEDPYGNRYDLVQVPGG